MAKKPSKQPLAERMASDAAAAVKLTDTYFCEPLDFTEASVVTLERLVEDVHYSMPKGKTPENIDLLCRLWGAYIGEVFRRNVGGEWATWKDQYGEAVALKCGGVTLFPHDKIRKRFVSGGEHNLGAYYQALRDHCTFRDFMVVRPPIG
jgi:hypothetical protein